MSHARSSSALEGLVRRDRLVVGLGLAAITILAWLQLARTAAGMQAMAMDARVHAAMGMVDTHAWGVSDWLPLFIMWAVMMVAMMLPSAAPVILLVLGVYRRRGHRSARAAAWAFVAGYLMAWAGFSAAAAGAQVGLHGAALLTGDMASGSMRVAGVILLIGGVYQWLPMKRACLTHCRSPLELLTRYWREGAAGALAMGLRHGAFCVGCCWALMTLLFVVGVMNLVWVAAIGVFVLLEKLWRGGAAAGRLTGALLSAWGVYALWVG